MNDEEAKALGRRALEAGFRWGLVGALYRTGPGPHEEWRCYAESGDGDPMGPWFEEWRCYAESGDGDPMGPWFVSGEGDVYGAEEESAPLAMIYNPWPDFRDPATLGVLVAQVREAWETHRGSDCMASTMRTGTGWGVCARYGSEGLATTVGCTHETEAHALVAALERCP